MTRAGESTLETDFAISPACSLDAFSPTTRFHIMAELYINVIEGTYHINMKIHSHKLRKKPKIAHQDYY